MGEDLMAVEFQDATVANTAGTTMTVPLPNRDSNSLLMLIIYTQSGTAAPDSLGNWTLVLDETSGRRCRVYTRWGDEVGTTRIIATEAGDHRAALLVFSGVSRLRPVHDTAWLGKSLDSGVTFHEAPWLPGGAPVGSMIVRTAYSFGPSNTRTWTWPSVYDKRVDHIAGSGSVASMTVATHTHESETGGVPAALATYSRAGGAQGCATIALTPSISRLHLGSRPAALMLGDREVEILGG